VCKVFKPEDMSPDLLVKSSGFKCEGPARGRAFSLNLRLSGVSRIWLWEKQASAIPGLSIQFLALALAAEADASMARDTGCDASGVLSRFEP
jgi:hypothetical protein